MTKPTRTPRPKPLRVPREKLAAVIERLADDYAHFVNDAPKEESPPDAKDYLARQAAARAGLAHIVELSSITTEDSEAQEATAEDILQNARADMAQEGDGEAVREPDA